MSVQEHRMTGEQLKKMRQALGWTQQQMAHEMQLSPTFIGLMERGDKSIERRTALTAMQIFNNHTRLSSAHRVIPLEGDVPIAKAQIIWDREDGVSPPVKVISIPGDDDLRYTSSAGACNADWVAADDVGRLLRLLALFVDLTAGEGIDPKVVNDAFSVIPEYRWAMNISHFRAGVEMDGY